MNDSFGLSAPLVGTAKRFAHRLLAVGENRLQLLLVELQEERERLLDTILLAVALVALALLCGMAWSAALVIIFWQSGPVAVLLALGAFYGTAAVALCWRLAALRRDQQTLAATLDQFRKDLACLEKN